jgi:hypothetical protein
MPPNISRQRRTDQLVIPFFTQNQFIRAYTRRPTSAQASAFDLLHGPLKPRASADGPEAEGIDEDGRDSDGGVVERLGVDRIELRETEDDQEEGDPERGDDRDWVRELAEVEGPSHEVVRVDDAQGDGHSYDDKLG